MLLLVYVHTQGKRQVRKPSNAATAWSMCTHRVRGKLENHQMVLLVYYQMLLLVYVHTQGKKQVGKPPNAATGLCAHTE